MFTTCPRICGINPIKCLICSPFRVNPPPSAVVSDGVDTFSRVIFLSSTSRFVVFIVVVVPPTVKSPGILTRPAELIESRAKPAVLKLKYLILHLFLSLYPS